MTSLSLAGTVVLVTGANGNVGWGVARAAQAAGASLVLPARSAARERELAHEFPGDGVLTGQADLLDEASIGALVDRALERFGRLDHVAAPVGAWWQKGASLEQPRDELRSLLEVYVEVPHTLVKALAPALRQSRGSFTLVTGAAGEHVIPGAGLLIAAVNGQYGLSRVLRAELAAEPFRLNELRIACRIEREPRPGVVPSTVAGETFVDLMTGTQRGALLRYTGAGPLLPMAE